MREEGNLLIFDYPGGQITFHKDLKKYYNIRNELWEERDKEKDAIDSKDEPAEIQRKLSIRLLGYIQKDLIVPLANYGLYDVTTEDFLVENLGYHDLLLATQRHYEYAIAFEDAMTSAAAKDKDQAAEIASQSITGMGFGVISNDWVAHALYAVQSKSVMDKQVAEAQARYNRMAATIDSTTRAATDKGIEKYKTDTYLPAVRKSIDAIFEYVLSKYCDCLSSVGRFDKSCLNGIDEARSNSILSNLDVVEDKDKVIYSAIQRCPYNLAIYTEIAKRGLQYSETHKDILNYLNLSSPLCDLLALRFPINPYLGLLQAHERVQPLISQIRYLESCDVVQATTKALSTYIKRDLTDYILFANEIKQHGSVKGLFAQREKITDRFQARAVLFKYHLPKETMDLYRSIDVDIFSTLSKILGRKISSFDEADTIILSAWN